jgi:hypothetical protein
LRELVTSHFVEQVFAQQKKTHPGQQGCSKIGGHELDVLKAANQLQSDGLGSILAA